MPERTLGELSERMKKIDFAMLSTRTENGAIASRPMSNNGEVQYTGSSFFFSHDKARTIMDIEKDVQVGLTFSGTKGLLGKPPVFLAVEGKAELIRDKSAFAEHWTKELDYWFKQGIDTAGLVLIKVQAIRIHYWDGEDQGEVVF